MAIPSPCIGVCRIDDASGLCFGCARTRDEIAIWRRATPEVQQQIWSELPGRRAKLGIILHQLGWTRDEIRAFVSENLRSGTWVLGAFGAVAEFCIGPDEAVNLDVATEGVVASTPRAAIRFEIGEQVRVLSFETSAGSRKSEVIMLTVPRAPIHGSANSGLTPLGPDREAIRIEDREALLYDLGLGMDSIGFCIRTHDPELSRELDRVVGQGWQAILANLGPRLLQCSPTRVVRSPIGRIEVSVPIPLPGGQSPAGPHTHLLPVHLATNRETPPGIELPESLAPCAIFYPEVAPADSCK
jgi:predicted Fe-S protein YdhL (DUF1289 family)